MFNFKLKFLFKIFCFLNILNIFSAGKFDFIKNKKFIVVSGLILSGLALKKIYNIFYKKQSDDEKSKPKKEIDNFNFDTNNQDYKNSQENINLNSSENKFKDKKIEEEYVINNKKTIEGKQKIIEFLILKNLDINNITINDRGFYMIFEYEIKPTKSKKSLIFYLINNNIEANDSNFKNVNYNKLTADGITDKNLNKENLIKKIQEIKDSNEAMKFSIDETSSFIISILNKNCLKKICDKNIEILDDVIKFINE